MQSLRAWRTATSATKMDIQRPDRHFYISNSETMRISVPKTGNVKPGHFEITLATRFFELEIFQNKAVHYT